MQTMTALGYSEALTYAFESPKVYDRLNIPQNHEYRNAIKLKNPLGEDFSIMRTLTLGGLLESIARNYNKGNESAALFEIADTYAKAPVIASEAKHAGERSLQSRSKNLVTVKRKRTFDTPQPVIPGLTRDLANHYCSFRIIYSAKL